MAKLFFGALFKTQRNIFALAAARGFREPQHWEYVLKTKIRAITARPLAIVSVTEYCWLATVQP